MWQSTREHFKLEKLDIWANINYVHLVDIQLLRSTSHLNNQD